MRGPAGAFVLVSLQMLGGTFAFMYLTMLAWRIINRGYFRSTTWVLWPLQLLMALAVPRDLRPLAIGVAAAYLLFLLAVYSQRPMLEWISGALGTALAVWLVVTAGSRTCDGCPALLHSIAGLLLLGAVTHGMVLGHWYLNQARLPLAPLKQATMVMFAAMALSIGAGVITRPLLVRGAVPGSVVVFSPEMFWLTWLFIMATTAVLGAMVWATVRSRSTQSATGLLYIAIVTALSAQFILDLLVAT